MEPDTISKTDTVTLIRSLVAMQSNNYTLKQLLDDFKNEMGFNMPTFEYKTALEFLRSIPEAVMVIEERKNVFVKLVLPQDPADIGFEVKRFGLRPGEENEAALSTSEAQAPPCQNGDEPKNKEAEKKKVKKRGPKKAKKAPTTVPIVVEAREVPQTTKTAPNDVNCYGCLTGEQDIDLGVIDTCLTTAILRGKDIPTINVAYYADVGDDVEVFVHEVCNPHKFYLRLKKFKNELHRLMIAMQTFYNTHKQEYRVEAYTLRTGDMCAAGYSAIPKFREWYRAKVIHAGERSCRVLFIDYGTTLKIRNCDLRYLDRKYAILPAQAIKGVLAYIKPKDGIYWSEDSCKTFYELAYEEEGVARILDIDSKNNSLTVNLSYGIDGDLSVAQVLIEKGYASPTTSPDGKVIVYESVIKDFLRPVDINMSRRPKIEGGGRLKQITNDLLQ